MNILLPEHDIVIGDSAEVRGNTLYLYKRGDFKDVMFALMYEIYGNDECYYCHRKLRRDEKQCDNQKFFSRISGDHKYPQDILGPTITNNLVPACTACNSRKSNMNEEEYLEYLRLYEIASKTGNQEILLRFREELLEKQEKRRRGEIPCLPADWIAESGLRSIWVNCRIGQKKGGSFMQMLAEATKYGHLLKPITITANNVLVDGFNANLVSMFLDVPATIIQMDNVIHCGCQYGERHS